MQVLRSTHTLARLVLVWFALYLGVATASPLVAPQTMEFVCSGAGVMKMLIKHADGKDSSTSTSSLDCPLCAPGGAPPQPQLMMHVWSTSSLAYVLQSIPAAHIASITAAPMPARGPPISS